MTRLARLLPLLLVAACDQRLPCNVSSECGAGEVCAASRCQALSCDSTWFAIDPADGTCRPLPNCGNPAETRDWVSCADPCTSMGEWDCIADRRCQPSYGVDRSFAGCRANPLPVDRCVGLSRAACDADPFCAGIAFAVDCNCAETGPCGPCESFECHARSCTEMHESECGNNPRCTSSSQGGFPPFDMGVPPSGFGTRSDPPFFGCFDLHAIPCFGLAPSDCRRRADCHAIVDGDNNVIACEPDDGLRRCNDSSECGAGERCNNDEMCAGTAGSRGFPIGPDLGVPPGFTCVGVCVAEGCAGNGERRCVEDSRCEPIYTLQCSPYGGGASCGTGGFPFDGGVSSGPTFCGATSGCEPSFLGCTNGPNVPVVDPGRSILCREPQVVDHVAFSFPSVMARLAGTRDANAFVEAWFAQLYAQITVGERVAKPRLEAKGFLDKVLRDPTGRVDIARLDFQVTSLANRIDLAGPGDCGEARITYALKTGVFDRRHRMTVIVELRQPDDGARCQTVAQKWVALSTLEGAALRDALVAIYDPLLTPAILNQVRTNEFLVGLQTDFNKPDIPWELREWRLGADGLLHLALSKQAFEQPTVRTPAWAESIAANREGVVHRSAVLPDTFLAVTSSENGARLVIDGDAEVEAELNRMSCAGCHTTETNTAFVHVGERFAQYGRAQISEVLRKELPRRSKHLNEVATGRLTIDARLAAKLIH